MIQMTFIRFCTKPDTIVTFFDPIQKGVPLIRSVFYNTKTIVYVNHNFKSPC